MADNIISLAEWVQSGNTEIQKQFLEIPSQPTTDNGGSSYMSDMKDRVAKLEGQHEGLKQSQLILLGAITVVSALLIGIGIYSVQKTEDLSKKVDALPTQISNQLRDLTQTLSAALTATRQQPPQVILMPAPQMPAPQQPTPPSNQK